MSWFDEAVARRQRAQRADESRMEKHTLDPVERSRTQQQEVEALRPLMERLLSAYGEHVFGKNFI